MMGEPTSILEETTSLAMRLSPLDKVRLVKRVMATLEGELVKPVSHSQHPPPLLDSDSELGSATDAADHAMSNSRDSAPRERSFFDPPPDLETLAREQGVRPIANLDDLVGDFWPKDESVDDFIAAVRAWRREGG